MSVWRIWTDERGTPSSARVLLWVVVAEIGYVIWRHLNGAGVDNAVWQLLTYLVTICGAWAMGPRLAQYFVPGVASVVGSMGQAVKRKLDRPYGPGTERFDDGGP